MLKQKTILIALGCLFLGGILGYFFSYSLLSKKINENLAFWRSLAEKCYPPLPEMVVEQTGEVVGIEDSMIYLKYKEKISRFPLAGGKEFEDKVIKVKFSPDTEIKKLEIIQDAHGNFVAQTITGSAEDIKVGGRITIISNENIKGKSEVFAHTIVILSQ